MNVTADTPRDHGGNLDAAIRHYGGTRAEWIDLSTGINPRPYPVPALAAHSWACLPTSDAVQSLEAAACGAYDTLADCVALAGAQSAIQLVPRLGQGRDARVLGPTYNEHAASLSAQGWDVKTVQDLSALTGADLAVVVNPNNPDGQRHAPDRLLALAGQVGLLVVDESFADPEPELSIAPCLKEENTNLLVLRSFGKFYGLAGLRLGFALGAAPMVTRLRALSGPWSVSGPAIEIGRQALQDRAWQTATVARLRADAARLDALASEAGWRKLGGTLLFCTYETTDAVAVQRRLARHHIWSRIFPYSSSWVRLGLADGEAAWTRLAEAIRS